MSDHEFLMRILRATAFNHCDCLFWRVDGEYAPIKVFVNCNDVFYWACSDLEEITPDNVHILEQSFADVDAVEKHGWGGPELFCARVRKERPQGAFYKCVPEATWPLFNAVGPEREVNLVNPSSVPEVKS